MATGKLPTHNVFTVEERGKDEDPFWLKIGAAFAHKDGGGFNIVLSAFPIDNRIVMRIPSENGNGKDDDPKTKSRRRQ